MYFIHININIHINVHINIHINVHINIYINIYINIHINIYTTFREIKPLYQCLIKQSLRKPTILMIISSIWWALTIVYLSCMQTVAFYLTENL